MSKMADVAQVIKDLHSAATAVNEIASTLEELFSSAAAKSTQASESTPVVKETELTLEEVRAVLSRKSADGFASEIRALIRKYGADRLSEVDHTRYKELLADVEELDHAG